MLVVLSGVKLLTLRSTTQAVTCHVGLFLDPHSTLGISLGSLYQPPLIYTLIPESVL